jgi:hypothetical protein
MCLCIRSRAAAVEPTTIRHTCLPKCCYLSCQAWCCACPMRLHVGLNHVHGHGYQHRRHASCSSDSKVPGLQRTPQQTAQQNTVKTDVPSINQPLTRYSSRFSAIANLPRCTKSTTRPSTRVPPPRSLYRLLKEVVASRHTCAHTALMAASTFNMSVCQTVKNSECIICQGIGIEQVLKPPAHRAPRYILYCR